jgi:uncharacterized protein (DUF362 family)
MTSVSRTGHHENDESSPHGRRRDILRPGFVGTWILTCTLTSGVLALFWLLLRSGTKPSRLTYPCQQAAFGFAAAAFGAPLVATLVTLRARLLAVLRTTVGKITVAGLGALGMVLVAAAAADPDAVAILEPPAAYHPDVYLVNDARGTASDRHGGVDDLITLMGTKDFKWHRSSTTSLTAGPDGLIDADDVVLVKVNAQWSQRGGTNTDVLRGVVRRIVEHPDGFVGEIIVADNGQGLGNLDRSNNNAEDYGQSPQDIVDDFTAEGWDISTMLWDAIRSTPVNEYSQGDMTSGYIVGDSDPDTQIRVSYPKFQSALLTYISYKYGIWSPESQGYDSDKLVVINMPVFKTHSIYAITASVKNHMGVITKELGTDSHVAVGRGGMGTILAEVRMPDLTILDCIWILARPGEGPYSSYATATRRNQLAASTDPVALDAWATKFIMIPQIVENGYSYDDYHFTQDPDNPESTFRHYLDLSMNELLAAGIDTTNDYTAVNVHAWPAPLSVPATSEWGTAVLSALLLSVGIIVGHRRGRG